jgi:hypothetical protein
MRLALGGTAGAFVREFGYGSHRMDEPVLAALVEQVLAGDELGSS